MMGIEEGIELGLLTVDGQGVLRQVIRTDAEEVYFFSQFFTHDGSGRRFDHDADFHVLIIGNAFFIQFLTDFIEDFFAPLYFPDGNDHREHDGNLAISRSAQEGAELRLEEVDAGQADADSPHAHSRVFFRVELEVVDFLIGADIQGTDDDGFAAQSFGRLFIGFELLVFCRIIAAFEIEKFTAEEADAFGIVGQDLRQIARVADVGIEIDLLAIFRDRRDTADLFQGGDAQFFFFLFLLHGSHRFVIGVDVDRTRRTVDDGRHVVDVIVELCARADDGGNAQRAGQDCRMRIRAASRGYETENLIRIELQRFAGSQVVSSNDDVVIVAEIDARAATELLFDTTGNIQDISGTSLHISVFHGTEHFGKFLGRLVDSRFSIHFFIADFRFDAFDVIVVIEHHLMDFKDSRLFFTDFIYSLDIQVLELANSFFAGFLEAGDFSFGIINRPYGRRNRIAMEQCQGSDADTGEDTFTF